jgi:hypothetical protein
MNVPLVHTLSVKSKTAFRVLAIGATFAAAVVGAVLLSVIKLLEDN